MDPGLLLIPLISGVIGYVTNFVGIKLLFHPVSFVGVRVPGLAEASRLLPRKLQNVPGLAHGRIGWQGIIPSRAAKMGSIAVDKGIAKLGSPAEFYEQLPDIVRSVTADIGTHIDQLLDIKLMVIRHIEADPRLANRIFLEVGRKELRFVVNSGFLLGALLGLPVLVVHELVDSVWILPVAGIVVGYLTNWIAIKVIFLPVEPTRIGPVTFHGLFMRRQAEVAGVYSGVIAEDIVTLSNIGHELVHGTRADRTREMIAGALGPAVDNALGPAARAVRVALGTTEYDAIRSGVATEAVDYTMTPLNDVEFNERQSHAVRELLTVRMKELPPEDFAEMLRSAIVEDEWMLILIGSVLGFAAGCLQVLAV